jgi:hypothetical protein
MDALGIRLCDFCSCYTFESIPLSALFRSIMGTAPLIFSVERLIVLIDGNTNGCSVVSRIVINLMVGKRNI